MPHSRDNRRVPASESRHDRQPSLRGAVSRSREMRTLSRDADSRLRNSLPPNDGYTPPGTSRDYHGNYSRGMRKSLRRSEMDGSPRIAQDSRSLEYDGHRHRWRNTRASGKDVEHTHSRSCECIYAKTLKRCNEIGHPQYEWHCCPRTSCILPGVY